MRRATRQDCHSAKRHGLGLCLATWLLGLGALGCATTPPRYPHAVATPHAPVALPAVGLVGPEGKPFSLSSLAGRWVWLYFGYTNCPDVCPIALSYLADEYKRLKHKPPGVLFVSVDPKRDDPAKLLAFARYHHPDFLGVTGPDEALTTLTRALGVSYVLDKPATPGGSYTVSHTNLVFLIDPEGREVATYVPGATPGDLATDTDALSP